MIQALNDSDWGAKTMSVRINGLDTPYTYRDVIGIVEACPQQVLQKAQAIARARKPAQA